MRILAYAFIALACTSTIYGISVLMLFSGTHFFLIWFVIAAVLASLGLLKLGVLPLDIPAAAIHTAMSLVTVLILALISFGIYIYAQGARFKQAAPQNLDAILVLGSQVRQDGEPAGPLRYRLERALKLAHANPKASIIVSGGKGSNEPVSEADAMAAYLMRQGIPEARIVREDASTSTFENFGLSKTLLDAMDARPKRIGIITNDFHVFRALAIGKRMGYADAGYGLVGIGAYSTPYYLANNILREELAYLIYLAQGRV